MAAEKVIYNRFMASRHLWSGLAHRADSCGFTGSGRGVLISAAMERTLMVRFIVALLGCITLVGTAPAIGTAPAYAQSAKPPEAVRPPANFDTASIRRQAAAMAEFKALLADPDATVRLLAMREAIRAGDASQRQMAIEAGLASNESSMLELALRGILTNIQQIVIEFTDADGKITLEGGAANYKLNVAQFDAETGKISGSSSCPFNDSKWSGQLQGSVFSFDTVNHICSGTMSWSGDTADFRGRVNLDNGQPKATRPAVWRPR